MTATFWTGSSLSFTNGSKTVTVNTGPSLDSVKANSSLTAGNYNEPVEVKSVSGNIITLYNNWPGSTGTSSATIKPSAAAAASAGVAAQQLITNIQSLVSSASVTATANSFVKRDSNGRIKAATPSANDDVVTKGFIGTAATKDVGTSAGNVMEVGAFGHGGGASSPVDNDCNKTFKSGNYFSSTGLLNGPVSFGYLRVILRSDGNESFVRQELFSYNLDRMWFRNRFSGTWSEWQEIYHSGNTNFNEFGGVRPGSSWVAQGFVRLPNTLRFIFPISSTKVASSFSFNGTASDLAVFVPSSGVSADLTGSTLELVTFDSNKLAIIEIRNAPTLPEGVQVYLSVDNGKKITFNF